MLVDQMNAGSYAVRHGAALTRAGYSFDGASDEAVELDDIDLAAYGAVDWFAGEDSVGDDPLPAAVRQAIDRLLASGGALLLSGSEVVWALADQGTAADQAFSSQTLRVGLVADDADSYQVAPLAGPMTDLAPFSFDDSGPGGYDAEYPDVLAPGPDAVPLLAYGGGGTAAVGWGLEAGGPRGIVLGFPFEVVAGDEARTALMGSIMALFEIEPEPADPDDDDDAGGDSLEPEGLVGSCGCGATSTGGAGGQLLLLLAALALARGRAHR
jgi:hypothetical protein